LGSGALLLKRKGRTLVKVVESSGIPVERKKPKKTSKKVLTNRI